MVEGCVGVRGLSSVWLFRNEFVYNGHRRSEVYKVSDVERDDNNIHNVVQPITNQPEKKHKMVKG